MSGAKVYPGAFTDEQAASLGEILGSADGGCYVCAAELCDQMAKVFPGYEWHRLAGTRVLEDGD